MKSKAILLGVLSLLAVGCCRGPVCTQEMDFYCDSNVNGGGSHHCAVDIIYPKDAAQLDQIITTIGPQKWFTSDLYNAVHKDKAWLNPGEVTKVRLGQKAADDPYVVIFAEFDKPDQSPPRGQEPYLLYKKETQPKGRKVEFIGVHEGSLQRLDGRPSRFP